MITAKDVTAIIVTRGDYPLDDIIATLPYEHLIVWNNSEKPYNASCYGRYLAMEQITTPVAYHQDDDLLFTAHDELLSAYEPGKLVASMPSPWFERTHYDVFDQVLPGAGSLMDKDLHHAAIDSYLKRWPADKLFLNYVDQIVGMLTPHTRLDLGYEILPRAYAQDRICQQDPGGLKRMEMRRRGLILREEMAAV